MKLFFKIIFKGIYHFIKNPRQRTFLWLVFKYGDRERFKEEIIKVNNLTLSVPDCLSFIWQYKEIFVDESYKFQSRNESPLIIDCGANIGLSVIYSKITYPNSRIIAIEANPEISKSLKQNIDSNGFEGIEIQNKAVWINEEGIEFNLENADSSSIFGKGNKTKIPTLRLRDLIQNENEVDFLKIDIEGAEYEVLKDCESALNNVQNVFVEYHSFLNQEQKLNEILDILSKNKFRYFIKPVNDRTIPFINKTDKNYPQFDLQLNIFAYKS